MGKVKGNEGHYKIYAHRFYSVKSMMSPRILCPWAKILEDEGHVFTKITDSLLYFWAKATEI